MKNIEVPLNPNFNYQSLIKENCRQNINRALKNCSECGKEIQVGEFIGHNYENRKWYLCEKCFTNESYGVLGCEIIE